MTTVKTFVVQMRDCPGNQSESMLQETWNRLDQLVATLGAITVHQICDRIHESEPAASPHSAECGYRIFPGEAAVVRIVVFSRP